LPPETAKLLVVFVRACTVVYRTRCTVYVYHVGEDMSNTELVELIGLSIRIVGEVMIIGTLGGGIFWLTCASD
jgi:hypothetical protein